MEILFLSIRCKCIGNLYILSFELIVVCIILKFYVKLCFLINVLVDMLYLRVIFKLYVYIIDKKCLIIYKEFIIIICLSMLCV